MKKKLLFIVNPVAGGKRKDKVPGMIQKYLDLDKIDYQIVISSGISDARNIAAEAIGKYDAVVAVGGDGTVNEVASAIVGSNMVLGIIPFGSGNGLSRFLSIPMDPVRAIMALNSWQVQSIDSAKVNDRWFFNMAGMGFDAHISEVFSHDKKRGFGAYFKSSIQEINNYKSDTYHLEIDGSAYDREAFMLSFANSSQYGNNAHVSPGASVQDGLLDVCVIKPFPLYRFPEMGLRMFTKTADRSSYVEIIRGKHIRVKRSHPGPFHVDGEPQLLGTDAEIQVVPRSLKVIVGNTFIPAANGKEI